METLFRGIWYRSAVKLEGETIVPVPPLEPYNPFDWYYSASEVRQGEKSLYLEFMAVDSSKPEEIVNFCERFGVLGHFYDLVEYKDQLRKEALADPDFVEMLGGFPEKVDALNAEIVRSEDQTYFSPYELCRPTTIRSFKDQQQMLSAVFLPPQEHFFTASKLDRDIAKPMKSINDSLRLHKVQPRINWNIQKAQWEFEWTSLSLLGFLYVMAMLDLLGPGKALSCPRCHKWFVTASKRVRFCTPSCYENYKVRKYQQKKKEELLAAQKGKKTKTRTSTGKKK